MSRSKSPLRLINLDRVNLPPSVAVRPRVLRNISHTRLNLILHIVHRAPVLPVGVAGEVAAERRVKDESVVSKLLIDDTGTLEDGLGRAESRHIWPGGAEGRRDGTSWEEPDLDELAGPLHGVYASAVVVEATAV